MGHAVETSTEWKPALNAFAITFADRMPTARTAELPSATHTVGRTGRQMKLEGARSSGDEVSYRNEHVPD